VADQGQTDLNPNLSTHDGRETTLATIRLALDFQQNLRETAAKLSAGTQEALREFRDQEREHTDYVVDAEMDLLQAILDTLHQQEGRINALVAYNAGRTAGENMASGTTNHEVAAIYEYAQETRTLARTLFRTLEASRLTLDQRCDELMKNVEARNQAMDTMFQETARRIEALESDVANLVDHAAEKPYRE
jgi:hypothetical protein